MTRAVWRFGGFGGLAVWWAQGTEANLGAVSSDTSSLSDHTVMTINDRATWATRRASKANTTRLATLDRIHCTVDGDGGGAAPDVSRVDGGKGARVWVGEGVAGAEAGKLGHKVVVEEAGAERGPGREAQAG